MIDTLRQEGREEGREQGCNEGTTRVVIKLLEKRLGQLPDSILTVIRALAVEESKVLGET